MIKYIEKEKMFVLETEHTEYAFCIRADGHLEHLYYGARTGADGLYQAARDRSLFETGNAIVCDSAGKDNASGQPPLILEALSQEISSYGKGDVSDPFVCMLHANGSGTCDFLYEAYEIKNKKDILCGLPSSYMGNEENPESAPSGPDTGVQLTITLRDRDYNQRLDIIYSVFADCDVITRSAKLTNEAENPERIERLMSLQLDIPDGDYCMTQFGGAWAREMHKSVHPLQQGRVAGSSVTGTSSSRCNPFFMVSSADTTEEHGICYAFNLIYSGNHYEVCDINSYGRLRVLTGICPDGFSWVLEPDTSFQTPEAVMSYSDEGFRGISRAMHLFVRKHIVRGRWADKERPVLLNSWEAAYFDIDEKKLLWLAKAAKDCGIELFVMDDGWFGKRDNDSSSLGDWYVNKKKLPGGVKRLADKVNGLGLDFGIWVEPEMVSENSDLYQEHPDWAVTVPEKHHAKGRNQMLLDLANPKVRDYIIEAMSNVFSSAGISYVKWDMNRIMSDCFSRTLPADRQQEFAHRYVLGLYEIMEKLTDRFPDILFEGCSAGGNRFDLGILCYMPQIWASDDTDARERTEIQTGYSYGYPMSVMSAHVSGCPNHQTLRTTPLETRFNIAAFGVLGYELNLCDMKKEEILAVKEQVEFYKKHRRTLQFGDYYRIVSGKRGPLSRGSYQFMAVSPDKKEAVACFYQDEAIPNYTRRHLTVAGLDSDSVYVMRNRRLKYNVKLLGDLVNTVTPVHIRQDSIAHNAISRLVRLSGEKEELRASGAVFNHIGVNLAPGFAGTGYNDRTALCQDFGSRIYIFEKENFDF